MVELATKKICVKPSQKKQFEKDKKDFGFVRDSELMEHYQTVYREWKKDVKAK